MLNHRPHADPVQMDDSELRHFMSSVEKRFTTKVVSHSAGFHRQLESLHSSLIELKAQVDFLVLCLDLDGPRQSKSTANTDGLQLKNLNYCFREEVFQRVMSTDVYQIISSSSVKCAHRNDRSCNLDVDNICYLA